MLKIVPMTENDYIKLGGQITTGNIMRDGAFSPRGLNSNAIFGIDEKNYDSSRSCTRSNVRGMIRLNKPVINLALAGSSGDMLRAILGINQKDFKGVLEFKLVWDKVEGRLESASNVSSYSIDEILCHGDILKKWIDEFNIKDATINELLKILDDFGWGAEERDITYGKGKVHIIGNWYFNADYLTPDVCVKLEDILKNNIISSGNERIVYLINLKDKNSLYGMLFNFISVLPPGIRPAIGNMHDQFTKKYSSVILRNDNLELSIASDKEAKEFIFDYAALVRTVNELIYKHNQRETNYKAIVEKLKGKPGFIRQKMLGKRADYSGRSAIIVNPELKLDECGIPEEMLPKIYRYHLMKTEVFPNLDKMKSMDTEEVAEKLEKTGILRKVPVILNRAPTLHRLSLLSFFVRRAKTKAIELHPLVCPGYNADFDGDTMAAHVPCSDQAVEEVRELMLSTRNLFTPANGRATLVPRQEIIYGLNVATKDYKDKSTKPTIRVTTLLSLKNMVLSHKVKVWDKVEVPGLGVDTAGRHVMRCCLPIDLYDKVKEVTKSSIDDYINWILPFGITQYKKSIDEMVEIGFKLAKIYAPTCNILVDIEDDFLKAPFKQFHRNMEATIKLHDLGFEDEEAYNSKFDEEFNKVEEQMKSKIKGALGEDNGYLKLVNSGARGSVDNLVQIYGYKGRIAVTSYSSLNAVIENSFINQLTPFEHFISAYGTRKGMIDKTQKTGDTGYDSRLMYQACSDIIIRGEDCKPTRGLKISKADISKFIKLEDDVQRTIEVEKIFKGAIIGRYEFGSDRYITPELASELTKTKSIVIIRSPITCKRQCCAKCYGEDLTIRGKAVVGLPVGFIAGQSIGEPGTQLTMRTFHKGGVAGKADVTSDFDRMDSFIKCSDMSKKSTYDPIAWADGKVLIKETPTDLQVKIEGSRVSKKVPKTANIKSFAVKGEGLCTIEGDHNIKEIIEYSGLEEAQKYLLFAMHTTYVGKADINIKHFEVLVSAMTLYAVIKTNRKDLRPGLFYSNSELHKGPLDKTVYVGNIKSVQKLQTLKNDPMSTILMENFVHGMSRSLVLGLTSNYETQMGRLMLGMMPKVGTGLNSNYIMDRRREEVFYGNDKT